MDEATKESIIEKAEKFKVEFDPKYWSGKVKTIKVPKNKAEIKKKFIEACTIIQSTSGLIVHLLEEEDYI